MTITKDELKEILIEERAHQRELMVEYFNAEHCKCGVDRSEHAKDHEALAELLPFVREMRDFLATAKSSFLKTFMTGIALAVLGILWLGFKAKLGGQ